ncbi:MAG TPA: PQQ-dependent sugar dehydrogenase, partial [Anaerolineales bacterium]|nr:PQQ-dependent sugar dehydrogenase [Anaerolineales bacterium]
FFMLDSDIQEPDGITSSSIQAAWLQTKLATSTSKWKLVVLHHAPYSSSANHGSNPDLQWPYAAWGADAVLAGHDHSYERLAIDGIQYFVNGSGGLPNLYLFGTPLAGSKARYNGDNGAMLIEATVTQLTFSFITRTGLLIDKKILTKNSIDPSKLQLQPVISGLSQPVFITHADDNSNRLFIIERAGKIRIVKNNALLPTPFLDMQSIVNSVGSEEGLLALAFHPQFESNGYFYTVHTNSSGSIALSRFTASPSNTDQASFGSRTELLVIPHPTNRNHNGGTLAFGPDGYLYWSTGDGGGSGDPSNNAQNLNSLLGKILRLDVNSASPYAVPPTNPFYNDPNPAVREEIWAYGLRNPWRFSFDNLTHDIYIGDVGQSNIEEIDFQAANSSGGENYGWRVMEGNQCYNPSTGCNQSGKVLPITQYNHTLGCSVTGGYVYRGSNYPSLYGHYFYGDYCSGRLFSIYKDTLSVWQPAVELKDTSFNISTFGEDEQRELYLADYATGTLYNIRYEDPVTLSGNVGVGEVTLSYTDGIAKTVTTSGNGGYSFQVSHSWNGDVTPSHPCYTFNPPSQSYSNVTTNQTAQNYTATLKPASGCAAVEVSLGGANQGTYGVESGKRISDRYKLNGGPMHVVSMDGVTPIFTSQRAIYLSSFNSIVGYPGDQLT